MASPVTVLISDDHSVVRKGIKLLLDTDDSIKVVGEAKDGAEAISKSLKYNPDVILMDLEMPNKDGIEAIKNIIEHQPEAKILVLTSFDTDNKVLSAIRAGAIGYLLKDSGPDDLIDAIHRVYQGEITLHPNVAKKLIGELTGTNLEKPLLEELTPKELQVLVLLAQGKTNSQIASILVIAEATARSHVSRILNKLDLETRTQAALFALKKGITNLNEIKTDTWSNEK